MTKEEEIRPSVFVMKDHRRQTAGFLFCRIDYVVTEIKTCFSTTALSFPPSFPHPGTALFSLFYVVNSLFTSADVSFQREGQFLSHPGKHKSLTSLFA